MININELTIAQVKELSGLINAPAALNNSHPFKVGESYLIRTVTMIQIGRLEAVHEHELVLSSASWIADTGRFYDALKTGKLNEVEPFVNDVIIGRASIIDSTIWTHKLPSEQK